MARRVCEKNPPTSLTRKTSSPTSVNQLTYTALMMPRSSFSRKLTNLLARKVLLISFLFSEFGMVQALESNYSDTFGLVTSFTLNNPFLKSETANQGMLYGLKGISMYSLMHGYSFLPIFVPPPREEHNWNRVRMTLQLFQHKQSSEVKCMYDWVVWMESDQVFLFFYIYTFVPSLHDTFKLSIPLS